MEASALQYVTRSPQASAPARYEMQQLVVKENLLRCFRNSLVVLSSTTSQTRTLSPLLGLRVRGPGPGPKEQRRKTCWDFDFGSCEGSKQQAEHRSALLRPQCPQWLQHAIMTEKGWILLGETEGVMPPVVLFGVWTRLEGQLLELRCAAGSDGADDHKWGPGWVSVIRPQLDHLQVATLYCMTTNCHQPMCCSL